MFAQQEDVADETDEPSFSQAQSANVNDALASFREQWQQELRVSNHTRLELRSLSKSNSNSKVLSSQEQENDEEKAKIWYLKGAELERAGIFYEAIQCYKKAVQLVPDIEFKVCQKPVSWVEHEKDTCHLDLDEHHEVESDGEEEDMKGGLLLQHIQRKMAKCAVVCFPAYEQRALHISSLPTEILLYIFKWVVSSDLDLRSLEVCSAVSRGFYLVARDSEIWRLACLRIWGVNCGAPAAVYASWREMFIRRPRLRYDGCYISKTTYIRHGENSFQDQFYRPWHLVTYYRYLRFFPEGVVLMLTTPDEPHATVSQLRGRNAKVALRGHYRLKDDRVVLVVQDQQRAAAGAGAKSSKAKGSKWQHESGEQTFHLEYQILTANKRAHMQLAWKYYAIFIESKNGAVTQSGFDITNSRFPPLWFSRVKSYTKETNHPLV